MNVGDRYRVKHTAVLRKYGVRLHNRFNRQDDHAWPGDVGTVTDSSYTTTAGERMPFYTLEFERGRRLVLDVTDDGRIVWPGLGTLVADFALVKQE